MTPFGRVMATYFSVLVIAGSAFAVIAVIVLFLGVKDLRDMFRNLRAEAGRR